MEKEYLMKTVLNAVEINRERLKDWLFRGFVSASSPSRGPKHWAKFTKADIYRIALFKHLVEAGIKREIASKMVNLVANKNIEAPLLTFRLDEDGKIVFLAGKEFYTTFQNEEITIIVNFDSIRAKTYI